jgi:hypothetical protein
MGAESSNQTVKTETGNTHNSRPLDLRFETSHAALSRTITHTPAGKAGVWRALIRPDCPVRYRGLQLLLSGMQRCYFLKSQRVYVAGERVLIKAS